MPRLGFLMASLAGLMELVLLCGACFYMMILLRGMEDYE
jgi:hypothetical protein